MSCHIPIYFPERNTDDYRRYGRILGAMKHDMDDERYQEAMQVLSWVVVAQRDLFWREIQGAVSLDLENRKRRAQ